MKDTVETHAEVIAPRRCRICGYQADRVTGLTAQKPNAGDFDICLECGALSVYTEDGGVRPPTDAERQTLPDDGIKAIAYIKNRGRVHAK